MIAMMMGLLMAERTLPLTVAEAECGEERPWHTADVQYDVQCRTATDDDDNNNNKKDNNDNDNKNKNNDENDENDDYDRAGVLK